MKVTRSSLEKVLTAAADSGISALDHEEEVSMGAHITKQQENQTIKQEESEEAQVSVDSEGIMSRDVPKS